MEISEEIKKLAIELIAELLEPDPETGKANYLHSPDCEGFCEYCCNGYEGFEWADALNKEHEKQKCT